MYFIFADVNVCILKRKMAYFENGFCFGKLWKVIFVNLPAEDSVSQTSYRLLKFYKKTKEKLTQPPCVYPNYPS